MNNEERKENKQSNFPIESGQMNASNWHSIITFVPRFPMNLLLGFFLLNAHEDLMRHYPI